MENYEERIENERVLHSELLATNIAWLKQP